MNRLKPHLALLVCNVLWAMDYPFYNIVLPHYVHPMAMVSASLVATALFSLVPLLWQKAEKVERADIRKLIGAALLIGVLRKVFIMYGLSMTSPIDGSIIDTIVPLLVLALSVLLGMDRFTRLKITGLVLGMAGAVAVVLAGLRELKCRFPDRDFRILIGSDNWPTFPHWRQAEAILRDFGLLIYPRPGYDIYGTLPEKVSLLDHSPLFPYSSTQVREKVACGDDLTQILDPRVARYIADHKLYRNETD